MAITQKHENCGCIPYEPDFEQYQIRYDGINYRCRGCCRFVSSAKWKGGKFEVKNVKKGKGTIMVFIDQSRCPCCGQKMQRSRKSKKKLVQSVRKQMKEKYMKPQIAKILPEKLAFINSKKFAVVTQH